MRVLGLDPSLRCTGYGLIERNGRGVRLLEGGVLKPPSARPFEERLASLVRGLNEIISGFAPDAIVVEELFSSRGYPRTALMMAHARGALVCAAALAGVPVFDYAATTVKLALVGRGGATKEQVARMVVHQLGLRRRPSPIDVTDALALALAHLQRMDGRTRY